MGMFSLGAQKHGTEITAGILAPEAQPSVVEVSGSGWVPWTAFSFGLLAQGCLSEVLLGGMVSGTEICDDDLDPGAQASLTEASVGGQVPETEIFAGNLHHGAQFSVVEASKVLGSEVYADSLEPAVQASVGQISVSD